MFFTWQKFKHLYLVDNNEYNLMGFSDSSKFLSLGFIVFHNHEWIIAAILFTGLLY